MVYPCGQKVIQPLLLDISNDEELTPQGSQLYFKIALRVRKHAVYRVKNGVWVGGMLPPWCRWPAELAEACL